MGLIILYWLAFIIIFLIGIGTMIFAKTKEKRKTGINWLIVSVMMLVVGAGVCGLMLSNLGNMH